MNKLIKFNKKIPVTHLDTYDTFLYDKNTK